MTLWLLTEEMESTTQIKILNKAVYISHPTNIPEKGRTPTILSPALSK